MSPLFSQRGPNVNSNGCRAQRSRREHRACKVKTVLKGGLPPSRLPQNGTHNSDTAVVSSHRQGAPLSLAVDQDRAVLNILGQHQRDKQTALRNPETLYIAIGAGLCAVGLLPAGRVL